MYLVDTNIWLERLLDQERSEEVKQFLDHTPSEQLLITDFSLHSIGVILTRLNRQAGLIRFVQDLFIDAAVGLISIPPVEMQRLVTVTSKYGLDFDDAYQYVAAEIRGAILVSFDSDFDRGERRKVTPAEVIATK